MHRSGQLSCCPLVQTRPDILLAAFAENRLGELSGGAHDPATSAGKIRLQP